MLRLLTLNIHKGFSWGNRRFVLHQMRRAIRSTAADIVFLQEVVGSHRRKAQKYADWPEGPQHKFLADRAWPQHAYGQSRVHRHGHNGNALLSRFPIVESVKVDISTNSVEQRGFLHCALHLPDQERELHCICVHLGLLAASRRKQLRMLAYYIERHVPRALPLVVAGDFNEWRGERNSGFGKSVGLVEVSIVGRDARARTFPAWLPLLPLDRIYCRGLTAMRSGIYRRELWSKLSDHAGLFAEVALALPRASA